MKSKTTNYTIIFLLLFFSCNKNQEEILLSDIDLDKIRNLPEEEKQNYRFGFKLAGGLGKDGEFLITPEVMLKWKRNYFFLNR